jgi:hypothetical protein
MVKFKLWDILFEDERVIYEADGVGFEVIIHSGKEHNPPHAHLSIKKVDIGKFLLTEEDPKSPDDIKELYHYEKIPVEIKEKLFSYATKNNLWEDMKCYWNRLNKNLTQIEGY